MAQRATPVADNSKQLRQPRARAAANKSAPVAAEASRRPRRDPVETIWTLFCSIRFAIMLNVVLALAAMLGTILPQMQPGTQNFPTAVARFLDGARGRYGGFADVLYWAGFFDLYNSLWFRMLVVLVVFGIIICTLNRWQPIIRLITNPSVRVSDAFLQGLTERAQFKAVPLDEAGAEQAVRRALRKARYRVLSERSANSADLYLYADRDRWSKLVTFVSHGALVLLIITAAGLANFGWREQSVYFFPGRLVNVGHGTDFSVRNDGFSMEYYPDGKAVKEYRNTLAVIEGGNVVLTKTIIVNDPLKYEGVTFFLDRYEPVLFARGRDSSGQPVNLRRGDALGAEVNPEYSGPSGEVLLEFRARSENNQPSDYLQFVSADAILTLQLEYYQDVPRAEGENPPVYVRGFAGNDFDKPLYDGFLPRTGEFSLPGYSRYRFSFRKETATVLEAAADPGLLYVGGFFAIMALGFTISLYTSFVRCWARISPSDDRPGTVNIVLGGLAEKNKISFERDFEKLATRVSDALATATKT